MNGRTDGQSDPYVALSFAGATKNGNIDMGSWLEMGASKIITLLMDPLGP